MSSTHQEDDPKKYSQLGCAVIEYERRQLLFESKDNLLRLEIYSNLLYKDDSKDTETIAFEEQLSSEPILREEVQSALRSERLVKASGEDGITADFKVKTCDRVIDFLMFFKETYEEGDIPGELRKNIIPLLKKPRAQECKEFRAIASMSHKTKFLQKILLKRIRW